MGYRSVLSRAASRLKNGFVGLTEYSKIIGSYRSSVMPTAAFVGGSALAAFVLPDLAAQSYGQLFSGGPLTDPLTMYTDSERYFADECIFAAVQGQGNAEYYMGIESPDGFSGETWIETDPNGMYMDYLYCFSPEDDPAGDYLLFVGNDHEYFEKTVEYVP